MIHITLFQPEIAPNTGNIGRTSAVTASRLHLIHPFGFEITDKRLRRAGLDYWRSLDVHEHADWDDYLASPVGPAPERTFLFSTHAKKSMWEEEFQDGDCLLFGQETSGAPEWLHAWAGERLLRIPQFGDGTRSLNLATAAAIATYEALRQIHRG